MSMSAVVARSLDDHVLRHDQPPRKDPRSGGVATDAGSRGLAVVPARVVAVKAGADE